MVVTLVEKERITNMYQPPKKKKLHWNKEWKSDDALVLVDDIYYVRFQILTSDDIRIGRGKNSDICIGSRVVSSEHARLCKNGERWILIDENSANGVYVNNQRVHGSCMLAPGDMVYIMGFRMIMGKGFLAINNPDNLVSMNPDRFAPMCHQSLPAIKKHISGETEYHVPQTYDLNGNESLEECIDIIKKEKNTLWSLTREHPHFLNIRIGANTILSLKDNARIRVQGDMQCMYSFCKGLLLRLIMAYSYIDVKIIFLLDDGAMREWEVARWLPHLYNNQNQQSYFARNSFEVQNIVARLGKECRQSEKRDNQKNPYYIVLGFNEALEKIWNESALIKYDNIKQIYFGMRKDNLQCDVSLELDYMKGTFFSMNDKSHQEFVPDMYSENVDMLYLQLANTYVKEPNAKEEYYRVELYVPAYEKSYDIKVFRNARIGEMLPYIEKQLQQQEKAYISSKGNAVLCDREAGIVLDIECTPEESGILNGTRLMLI